MTNIKHVTFDCWYWSDRLINAPACGTPNQLAPLIMHCVIPAINKRKLYSNDNYETLIHVYLIYSTIAANWIISVAAGSWLSAPRATGIRFEVFQNIEIGCGVLQTLICYFAMWELEAIWFNKHFGTCVCIELYNNLENNVIFYNCVGKINTYVNCKENSLEMQCQNLAPHL